MLTTLPRGRLVRFVVASAVSVAVLAGISGIGVMSSMAEAFPPPPPADGITVPTARPAPDDRYTVAVVLGATGSVAADVLIPYEVFARSSRFFVYTVAETPDPVTLSGAVHLAPHRTFSEVRDAAEPPDVVVVPAVADPTGEDEASMRAWLAAQAESGSHILGVCAGSEVLAASGVLDGKRATSHWARIGPLGRAYPDVDWVRGERYTETGSVTTTGGITSAAAGALRVLERFAGRDEAAQVGHGLGYPEWSPVGETRITERRHDAIDVPYWLNAAFPWSRPTIALGLQDGVGEIEVAAAAEVYGASSFTSRTVAVSRDGIITTRHGLTLLTHPTDQSISGVDRIVVPGADAPADVEPSLTAWAKHQRLTLEHPETGSAGQFPFDPYLRDLARTADHATALATAKYLEYPSGHLQLDGRPWPWRPTTLLAAAALVSILVGWLAATALRVLTTRPGTAGSNPTLEG